MIEIAGDGDAVGFEHVVASRFDVAASLGLAAPWLDLERAESSSVSCSQLTSCSPHLVVQ